MLKTILAALDGTPWSDAAVDQGIRWAQLTGAELSAMAVVDEPTICKAEPVGIGGSAFKQRRDEALLAEARTRVRQWLDQFAEKCRAAGVRHQELLETGLPSERVLSAAADIDITLLGQQTHFHFETQPTPCETLKTVLRGSNRPVVAVPLKAPSGSSIVLAYDATPPSVRALHAFQAAGVDEGRTVHVISVSADANVAARRAEEAAEFLRFFNITAQAHPLTAAGVEADIIREQAAHFDARMLVMGAFGKSRLAEVFTRSTTSALLQDQDRLLFCHH